jgi:branched-subunit amino acid aminotransferase/4-amino-4-deoxychorismate lyase
MGEFGERVFFNGDLVSASEARLPFDDRAVLYGDSVFETVRVYRGTPFRLWRHLERLTDACRVLRLDNPWSDMEITAAVAVVLEANGLLGTDARVRVTLTGGPSTGPKGLARPGTPGLLVTAKPYEPPPESHYREGISLAISGIKRNTSSPASQLKTANYLDSLLARQEAFDRGAHDAVMLTTAGNLAEATSSNLFMVKDGELLTPNVGCAFLPGITREAIVEIALENEIPCREVMEGVETLMGADEVFLTNSMVEVLPVRVVGTRTVPECPGPLTARLSSLYQELVERETS